MRRLESVFLDARFALRGLRRSPGFAAVAILTLALGIGANAAIFAIVNALLLRALPVASPDRLALVSTARALERGFSGGWTYAMWDQIRLQRDLFADAAAWSVFPQPLDLARGGERQPA